MEGKGRMKGLKGEMLIKGLAEDRRREDCSVVDSCRRTI